SLSRLTSAKNPESGTITYTYPTPTNLCSGDASAVCTKIDARSITTTFAYADPLNRLTGKSYSNGNPSVSFVYDSTTGGNKGKGRRTSMSVGASGNSSTWFYDSRGRVTQLGRTLDTNTKNVGYSYNLDGSIASVVYPSGRTMTYTSSTAGRVLTMKDTANSINYVTQAL